MTSPALRIQVFYYTYTIKFLLKLCQQIFFLKMVHASSRFKANSYVHGQRYEILPPIDLHGLNQRGVIQSTDVCGTGLDSEQ